VPPQVPPTDAVYPAFGVTVKDAVDPWFTVCAVLGLMLPPDSAEGVTVHVWMVAEQLAVEPADVLIISILGRIVLSTLSDEAIAPLERSLFVGTNLMP